MEEFDIIDTRIPTLGPSKIPSPVKPWAPRKYRHRSNRR